MPTMRANLSNTVLLVDDQEWKSRSVESILRPKGLAVLKAFTGHQALDLANRISPDLIMVDFHLPDMDGIDLVRELATRAVLDPVTPLLMLSSSPVGRAERLEALGAGAWDIFRHPLDPVEFLLRLENLLAAKKEADRLRAEIITDPTTGFYNARGVLRRARELSADSARFGRTLACIAVGPEWAAGEGDSPHPAVARSVAEEYTASVASALRAVVRESDAVGRLGPGEFVIVLSGVDQAMAAQLAERVVEQASGAAPGPAQGPAGPLRPADVRLRVGVYVADGGESIDPERLLSRATLALRRAQGTEQGFPIRPLEA